MVERRVCSWVMSLLSRSLESAEAEGPGGKEGQRLLSEGSGSRVDEAVRGPAVEDSLYSPRRWAASRRRPPAGRAP